MEAKRIQITVYLDKELKEALDVEKQKAGSGVKKNSVYTRIMRKGLGMRIQK